MSLVAQPRVQPACRAADRPSPSKEEDLGLLLFASLTLLGDLLGLRRLGGRLIGVHRIAHQIRGVPVRRNRRIFLLASGVGGRGREGSSQNDCREQCNLTHEIPQALATTGSPGTPGMMHKKRSLGNSLSPNSTVRRMPANPLAAWRCGRSPWTA